jgi:hypothetical protein
MVREWHFGTSKTSTQRATHASKISQIELRRLNLLRPHVRYTIILSHTHPTVTISSVTTRYQFYLINNEQQRQKAEQHDFCRCSIALSAASTRAVSVAKLCFYCSHQHASIPERPLASSKLTPSLSPPPAQIILYESKGLQLKIKHLQHPRHTSRTLQHPSSTHPAFFQQHLQKPSPRCRNAPKLQLLLASIEHPNQ